jgi:Fe-S-cluster containining protein
MKCNQCSACCVEISISSAIPGMPNGKKAGEKCVNLKDNLCSLFGSITRPLICSSFQANEDICGLTYEESSQKIQWYERMTS